MAEKFSSIDRVIGAIPDDDKNDIIEESKKAFREQNPGVDEETRRSIEIEKTENQIQIIGFANNLTNNLLRRLGLPEFNIPPRNIHLVRQDFLDAHRTDTAGVYSSIWQSIAIGETETDLAFAHEVIHEMLHFKSHGALQISTNGELTEYRSGLSATDRAGEKSYLSGLNEAAVEVLTKAAINQLIEGEPLFAAEVQKTERAKVLFEGQVKEDGEPVIDDDVYYATGYADGNGGHYSIQTFSYRDERKALDAIADKISEKSHGEYDYNNVSQRILKGMFQGNLLPLAKLIEKTLGKGAFRKIVELDEDPTELRKYIESL